MIKIRQKLFSWDEGRAFMNRLADEFGETIQEIDADLRIENDSIYVNCHFDDREFSFILIKLQEEKSEAKVKSILSQFKEKS